jgi:hypothetical protein
MVMLVMLLTVILGLPGLLIPTRYQVSDLKENAA